VGYRVLMKARETIKAIFGESHTYDWGSELVRKHPDDPLVLCYAVSVFLAHWNSPFYRYFYGYDDVSYIAQIVKDLRPLLEDIKDLILRFRSLKLDELPREGLEGLRNEIVGLYNRLAGVVGHTGASKVLHMLAPSFFVMWDGKIREHYGLQERGDDYFRFLVEVARPMICGAVESYSRDRGVGDYSRAREELERELGKPLTKVVDEYNWLTITKGYNLCGT